MLHHISIIPLINHIFTTNPKPTLDSILYICHNYKNHLLIYIFFILTNLMLHHISITTIIN